MIKQIVKALILLSPILLNAQKVDIDNYRVSYEFCNLPSYYVEPEKRTYYIEVNGEEGTRVDKSQFKLFGFKPADQDYNIKIDIQAGRFMEGRPNKSVRSEENKDKDGKVISTTNYYSYSAENYGPSSLNVLATDPGVKYIKKKEEKDKDKKKKKDDKPVEENPFLKNTTTSQKSSEDKNQKKIISGSMSTSYSCKGAESRSESEALKNFQLISVSEYNNSYKKYLIDLVKIPQHDLNVLYGYFPIKMTLQKFKILDSKDHPEYKMFKQASEASKVLFERMTYNSDVEILKKDFAPILEYFSKLESKLIDVKDKNNRKLKAAALYNIGMINYVLGNFDETEKACNEMIRIEQDEDDAEDLLEKVADDKPLLLHHKMASRHLKE